MDAYEPFLSLGLAIAAGLLIGLEREQSAPADREAESFLGGARTHPLVALVGGLATLLARQLGPWMAVAALAALLVFLAVNYADDVRRGADRGLTSEAAFLVSFLLGAVALSDGLFASASRKVVAVAATAVVVTLLLSAKPVLQPVMRRASREDVYSTLKFLIVAVVVLPLLPDRTVGPLDVLNPRQIGWMMTLITGLSFAGYAAIRLMGPERGLGLTGLVGGLVSSTAVTLSMSSRARQSPGFGRPLALAVVLASSVMVVRVAVVVGVVSPALLGTLWRPLAAMAAAGFGASAWLARRRGAQPPRQAVAFENPVELRSALGFALLYAAVLLGSKALSIWLGAGGAYAAALVAGATDMDAIAISMTRLAQGGLDARVATAAIFVAAASNTVVKAAMARIAGGKAFGTLVAAAFGAMLAAGGAGLAIAWL
ncbi:MAG TPA: DUF4010 domain-containing protein [Anaeromyxobacteraceae bacterium]|nr:DUF4010 domain-containing protein [Anaeromyxobacteraceae bacterium]